MPLHNAKCFANHMGFYAVEPMWLQNALAVLKAGLYQFQAVSESDNRPQYAKPYMISNRVALMSIDGPMMKGQSKMGGCNTLALRQAVRTARVDPDVGAACLIMDSPGGTVAGTEELANDVKAFAATKPIYGQTQDSCASACYWVASQCSKIFSNATGQVGSIGTFTVLQDTSKAAEIAGIKTYVISTGPFKATGVDGAPVTDEQLAYVQDRVNTLNSYFLSAVKSGRNLDFRTSRVADGRMFMADEAKKLGLIDGVQSLDETIYQLVQIINKKREVLSKAKASLAKEY